MSQTKFLIGILIVALLFSAASIYRMDSLSQQLDGKDAILKHQLDSIEYVVGQNGELIAEKTSLELTTKQLKDNIKELGLDKKELRKRIGNLNNLVAELQAEVEASGQGQTAATDTVYALPQDTNMVYYEYPLNWTNSYLTLNGKFSTTIRVKQSELSFENQMLDFTYDYNFGFQTYTYYKRDRIFKPKQLYMDISFEDPSMKAVEFRNIQIKQPKKKLHEKTWVHIAIGAVGGYFLAR